MCHKETYGQINQYARGVLESFKQRHPDMIEYEKDTWQALFEIVPRVEEDVDDE